MVWAAAAAVADWPAACFCVRYAASESSARMLSQSPRLDRDSAIHSRRNGLMDSTPGSRARVPPRGAAPGLPPVGATPVARERESSRRKAYRHW